jgi:DNA adenine methylase
MRRRLQPVIKWSGSKRRVADALHRLWPEGVTETATYFEPFVGSGAMLPGRPVNAAVAGDTIAPLIALWHEIAVRPEAVAAHYRAVWEDRQRRGQAVFYEARERFNDHGTPLDFLVLSRMCVNGLIRFNASGGFNNSLHHTRPGIHPDRLGSLIAAWSEALEGVHFAVADYASTLESAQAGDLVFLDPPYVGTRGQYRPGVFDFKRLCAVLEDLNARDVHWILTLDGQAGDRAYDETVITPDLYRHRFYVTTGHSPFTRLMKTSLDEVREAVYMSFEPATERSPAR